jgi:hypothetical protein
VAALAQVDNHKAYIALASLAPTTVLTGTDLGTLHGVNALKSGVYFFASSAQLTGNLQLDAEGKANPYWVFQIGSTLTTASASSVTIINPDANGSSTGGLYWQVGDSATLGTSTDFEGTILALTSITLTTTAKIHNGRALAFNGAVTMDTNTVDIHSYDTSNKPFTGTLSGGLVFSGPGQTGPLVPVASVPEPASLAMLGIGVFSIAGCVWRRRKKAANVDCAP